MRRRLRQTVLLLMAAAFTLAATFYESSVFMNWRGTWDPLPF
jgi:hypothetical protein